MCFIERVLMEVIMRELVCSFQICLMLHFISVWKKNMLTCLGRSRKEREYSYYVMQVSESLYGIYLGLEKTVWILVLEIIILSWNYRKY